MDPIDLEFDLEHALQRLKITKDNLNSMRKNLPDNCPCDITDKQLLLFLNACDFSIEQALKVIKIYYDARSSAPEYFDSRIPESPEIQQCLENQAYFVIPPVKENGNLIVYHKLMNSIASNYMFDHAVKTYCLTIDAALHKYGPATGIIFIHDMEFVRFSHIFRANLSGIRKLLSYLQYGLPAKVSRIHVFNVNSIFNRVLALVKPFLKKELLSIIHTYPPNTNYDEFHEKWIPKTHLPSEYGGTLGNVNEMHSKFCNEILRLKEHLQAEEKQRKKSSSN